MGRLLGVALALGLVAGGALAAAPYDFTGHWTGAAQESGQSSAATVTADFTATGVKTFTGTMTVAGGGDQPLASPARAVSSLCVGARAFRASRHTPTTIAESATLNTGHQLER